MNELTVWIEECLFIAFTPTGMGYIIETAESGEKTRFYAPLRRIISTERKMTEMKNENLLTRMTQENGELVYQLISSEAFCLREEKLNTVYSVLVARTDGEAVLESKLIYDVSRKEDTGRRVLEELWSRGAYPREAEEKVEELL